MSYTIIKPKEVKIVNPGDSEFKKGDIVCYYSNQEFNKTSNKSVKTGLGLHWINIELEAQGKKKATFKEEGCFPGEMGEGKCFANFDEVLMAYDSGALGLHAPIKVRNTVEVNGEKVSGIDNA